MLEPRPVDRSRIVADVSRAGDVVAPMWPLTSFVAVNPLAGLDRLVLSVDVLHQRRVLEQVKTAMLMAVAGPQSLGRTIEIEGGHTEGLLETSRDVWSAQLSRCPQMPKGQSQTTGDVLVSQQGR